MVVAPPASPPGTSPREALLQELVAIAGGGPPRVAVLLAPRGWGKRLLLERLRARIEPEGPLQAYVDLGRCVTHPDEFALGTARGLLAAALPAGPDRAAIAAPDRPEGTPGGPFGRPPAPARFRALAAAASTEGLGRSALLLDRLASLMSSGRGTGETVVETAISLPAALAADKGRPVLVLAPAIHEIGRLAPFPGLKRAPEMLARHLARASTVRLIASASPAGRPRPLLEALAREMPGDASVLHVPPLSEEEVGGLIGPPAGPDGAARTLLRLTAGRPLTAGILARELTKGSSMEEALSRLLAREEGALFQELRFDYHLLIERTRGHAASRAILNVLAREEGLDLSGIARRLRRSGGSTLDYIRWLQEVDLLHRRGRRYFFSDPLLRLYVLLHEAPERPSSPAERDALIRRALAGLEAEPVPLRPLGRPPGRRAGSAPTRPAGDERSPARETPHGDALMEID